MAASIEQLSFELTANALNEQERALSGLRTCAGTVLGAASIAGSLIAATASRYPHGIWGILTVIAFASCSGSAIWVLLPHDLTFAGTGGDLLATSDQRGMHDVAEAYRTVDSWLEPHLLENRLVVARLSSWLTLSCVLLATEVAFWVVSLVG